MTESPAHARSRDAMEHLDEGLRQLPERVLHLAMEACGATNGSLFLLDGERVTYRILAHPGSFAEVKAFKVERALTAGLAGWALRQRQGALCADTRGDERWVNMGEYGDDTASAIAMPVNCCGREIAVITLHHESAHHFTEAHLAAVAEVARQVAGLVEACRLGLRAEQTRLELEGLAAESPAPALVLDADGILQSANAAALRELTIPAEQAQVGGLGSLAPLIDPLLEPGDDGAREIENAGTRFRVRRFGFPGQGTILFFIPVAE